MNLRPPEPSTPVAHPSKDIATKGTEPSVAGDLEFKQKSLATETKESNNDVQSFVIVNDIDVEEEISKAKKEQTNYFQVLSMSFYGKVKSHSHDSKKTNKLSVTAQSGGKPTLGRKGSAQSTTGTKKSLSKASTPKQRSQENLKKAIAPPPINNLQIKPDNLRKRVTSPKDESIKLQSPVVAGKKYQVGHFSAKTTPKKDTTFVLERPQTSKKPPQYIFEGEDDKASSSPSASAKTSQTRRSSSPKTFKKTAGGLFKSGKKPQIVLDLLEEKTQTLDIEPSALEIRPQGSEEVSHQREINLIKGSKTTTTSPSKPSSRRNSVKPSTAKEKSVGTPNNSGRSLPSTANSQAKISVRDGQELKIGLFETDLKASHFLMDDNGSCKDKKKIDLKLDPRKFMKPKGSKEMKAGPKSEGKSRHIELTDFQDSELDDESFRKDEKSKLMVKKDVKKGEKIERQKSPTTSKRYEKIPMTLNGGIGGWDIKSSMIEKEALVNKIKQKEKDKRASDSPPKMKKESPQSLRNLNKNKTSSTEKLGKVDVLTHWKIKKGENEHTPKGDVTRIKDDKNSRIYDVYGKYKETHNKTRPTSPVPVNGRGPFDLFDKLLSHKKVAKEKA